MPHDYSRCAGVYFYDGDTYIVVHRLGIPPFTEPQRRICKWWRVPTMVYSGEFFKKMNLDLVPVYYEDAMQLHLL